MARQMTEDVTEVFRTVVKSTSTYNSEGVVQYYGPFMVKGAASAALTRETRVTQFQHERYGTVRTGRVERAKVAWGPVEP